jgi:hypothetical protein
MIGPLIFLFLMQAPAPRHYVCPRAPGTPRFDGYLSSGAWKEAPWTEWFVDIEGPDRRPAPRFKTRAKLLWDDSYLYIAAELEEPMPWATLTEHDSVIFHDHDFEVFLDPDSDGLNYFEFEINALNTSWDLFLPKTYRNQGKADNSWEIPGLRTAVQVNGRLNDPRIRSQGWTVEIAFPWSGFRHNGYTAPKPREGDTWRINFSRVEWQTEVVEGKIRKVAGTKEDNWVWSPQGEVNMHAPEHWGYVQFVGTAARR